MANPGPTPRALPHPAPGARGSRMSSRPVMALAMTALLILAACGPPPSPSASAALSPTAPPSSAVVPSPASTASPSPAPSLSPAELAAAMKEIEASVAPVRQLEARGEVPNRVVDEAGLRKDLQRFIAEGATPEEYAAQARIGERMGFFPAGIDLAAVQLELLGDQVLGYYDDDRKEMTVVQRGGAFGPLERVTLAHETTHALQDQHFDLDTLDREDLTNGDRSLARTALVEGDASLLTQQWALGNLSMEELLAITKSALDPDQMDVLARVPRLLGRQLEFPYAEGLAFASDLYGQGGWPAVDAAYARPPDSTEQVLHPEKYVSREAPIRVPATVRPKDLGKGWKQGWVDTMGELAMSVWLEPTAGVGAARTAAAGWGGDRVVMLEGPDDAWLIDWPTAWDTSADAEAFAEAATMRASELGSPATVSHTPGSTEVRVRIASDGELLRAPTP